MIKIFPNKRCQFARRATSQLKSSVDSLLHHPTKIKNMIKLKAFELQNCKG